MIQRAVPSFEEGVTIRALTIEPADDGGYIVTTRIVMDGEEPTKAKRKRSPKTGRKSADQRPVNEDRVTELVRFMREHGGRVTGKAITEGLGWDSSIVTRVTQQAREPFNGRPALLRLAGREGLTHVYALMAEGERWGVALDASE